MTVPRIAVVGPGAIGGVFAAAAWQAGGRDGRREIVLCARRRFGQLVVTRDGRDPVVVDAPVRTDPGTAGGPADWVFLAVKAHQTGGVRDWLQALTGPATVVVVLQNGVEHRERVKPLAGEAVVLPAIVRCPAEATAPGQVRLRGEPQLTVPDDARGQALARLLDGGAEVSLTADFTTEAWRKLCENAMAGLMVLTGRRAATFRRAEVAALARDYALECIAVARAEGARLTDDVADAIVAGLAAMPPGRGSSIVFDREAGRPLEWEARNGVVRRAGARHGIPTPVSDVVVPLLAAASGLPRLVEFEICMADVKFDTVGDEARDADLQRRAVGQGVEGTRDEHDRAGWKPEIGCLGRRGVPRTYRGRGAHVVVDPDAPQRGGYRPGGAEVLR
jgi:2-dehydropantoate 2-reductase